MERLSDENAEWHKQARIASARLAEWLVELAPKNYNETPSERYNIVLSLYRQLETDIQWHDSGIVDKSRYHCG